MFGVWDLPVEPKLQYKDNIYYMAKTGISKNDLGLTDTCGMSVTGLLFYRYLAYRCKHFHISLKRLVGGGLAGIRIALAENKVKSGKIGLVVEEMDSTQARLFSHLNLGKFITG